MRKWMDVQKWLVCRGGLDSQVLFCLHTFNTHSLSFYVRLDCRRLARAERFKQPTA